MKIQSLTKTLKRYPHNPKDLLQAWDSADVLILEHVASLDLLELKGKRVLTINDSFGALACSLAAEHEGLDITSYTDSYVSSRGIQLNSQNKLKPLSDLGELSGVYDYVLIRIPKNLSFFEDILCHLSAHLAPSSKVICGFMVKYHVKAAFELLNKYMGETTTSLAQKKARLIFAGFQREKAVSPYPLRVPIESFEHSFVNHSNLFSREKLDVGTRFLLEHIPQGKYKTILDLGCGNGIVGIAAKKANPSAKIIFSDESQMAIQSAKANYAKYFSDPAEFHWIHCYEGQPANSVDLVICNPPFHQGTTLGDFVARQMFADAHRVLVPGGRIRVVGNSHLQYQVVLKKWFENSRMIDKNEKFIIADATK